MRGYIFFAKVFVITLAMSSLSLATTGFLTNGHVEILMGHIEIWVFMLIVCAPGYFILEAVERHVRKSEETAAKEKADQLVVVDYTNLRNSVRSANKIVLPVRVREAFYHIHSSDSVEVRMAAAWYIIELGEPALIAMLFNLPDEEIHHAANRMLAQLGQPQPMDVQVVGANGEPTLVQV